MKSPEETEPVKIPEGKTSGTAYDTLSAHLVLKEIDGKTLYTPLNVVFSSMVSASIMHTCVWKCCSGWSVCWMDFPGTLLIRGKVIS